MSRILLAAHGGTGSGGAVRLASLLARQLDAEVALLDGHPARSLLDFPSRSDGDLIALGSHGYGLWKRLTLGSVASKVIRLATRSVLVAPLAGLSAAERYTPQEAPTIGHSPPPRSGNG